MRRVYLDHNATTPLDPRVLDAMLPFLRDDYGNPSSLHWFGQRARGAVEEARGRVAELLGADPAEIVFTSGGSESDNAALRGATARAKPPRSGIVCTAIEHHAVLNTAKALRDEGRPVAIVRVGEGGAVDLEELAASVSETTALVSVMLANNETGVLQPVAEAARLAHARGALVHCDAVQGAGKVVVDVRDPRRRPADPLRAQGLRPEGRGVPLRAARHAAGGVREGRRTGAQPAGRHGERGGRRRLRRGGGPRAREPAGRRGPRRGAARPARGAPARDTRCPAQRRGPPGAEHHQRVVRGGRGGGADDRPRPGRDRGLDGRRLCRGRRRALARAASDGPPARAGRVLATPLARPGDHRATSTTPCRRGRPRSSPGTSRQRRAGAGGSRPPGTWLSAW